MNCAEKFLKANLDKAVAAIRAAGGDDPILLVHDSEEWNNFATTEEAAKFAREVDAMLMYRVRNRKPMEGVPTFSFGVIYDGPYDADNAEEIIYDCNEAASKLMEIA